MILVTTATQRL